MRRQQSGLALLMVLLIFALVSVLATAMIDRQSMDIQRTTSRLATQQARALAQGVESVARSGLYLDWDDNPDIDHDQEDWAIDRSFPMENGRVFVHIVDAQGLFNLNWLTPTASNHSVWQTRFARLLKDLGLNTELASRLAGWFNEESQADDYYSSLDLPYRAAYRACSHPSELLLVEGMDMVTYKTLLPYITCLPATSQLNVNTALDKVLASLGDDFGLDGAMAVIAERGEDGIGSVSDFWSIAEVVPFTAARQTGSNGNNTSDNADDGAESGDTDSRNADNNKSQAGQWDQNDFTVWTEYFQIFTRIDLGTSGEWIATSQFMLRRTHDTGQFAVISRDYSRREAIQIPLPDPAPLD